MKYGKGKKITYSLLVIALAVFLTVAVISIVITIMGLLFRRPILSFIFGKVEQDVMDNAVTYFLYTAAFNIICN